MMNHELKAIATSSLERYPANAKPILIPPESTQLTNAQRLLRRKTTG